MSVINVLGNLSAVSRVGQPSRLAQGSVQTQQTNDQSLVDFRRARTRLLRLYTQLEKLAELADVSTRFRLDLADARSSSALGLDLTHTAATLNSTEEINPAPMSFGPFGPEWVGSSSALVTIGGEYEGDQGTDTLTLEVLRAGTHGVNDLRIRVEDSAGDRVRTINIDKNDDEDQEYNLSNGLFLTLGPGSLTLNDTTTIQVFDNLGAAVDPTKPLNGVRNDNPNLEYGVAAIVNGAFSLNGENISVSTTDTINDVISRINASAAGVTATFNATDERIDFLQNTLGSVPTIDLQNDTSNLLDALKLSGAAVTPGIDPEDQKVLDDVANFSSVASGVIRINDTDISLDTGADSLADIIDRINNSAADVTAEFDPVSQQVVIEAQDADSELTIDSNGTNFFSALNMVDGRVDPEVASNGLSRARSYQIADVMADVFDELGSLFRDSNFLNSGTVTSRFRSPLQAALQSVFGGGSTASLFGMAYNNSEAARRRGDIATIDRQALTRDLQFRGDQVKSVLGGTEDQVGMLERLLIGTRQALLGVNDALGIKGTFIDTRA